MRYFSPSISEVTGGDSSRQPVSEVPTGMENDPNADEEVINQTAGEQYPESVKKEDNPSEETQAKLTSDNLADSIAYALDGTGSGPMNEKPNVSGHDVISEGTSGAGSEEEERIFGK